MPSGVALWLCAGSLAVLVLVSSSVALTEYRVSDDFRLVGQIDFSTALQYFHQTSGFGRNEYRPLVMAQYAYDLANAFHSFYHAVPVLQSEDESVKAARLRLVASAKQTIANALRLLDIKAPEVM